MSGETDEREETNETEAKPTITIAEREGSETQTSDAQPTITIAERDGGK
jgi:hypothetical protein